MTIDNAPVRAREVLFAIGLALLLSHELDAVQHAEWQVLPLLHRLDDAAGYVVFVLAHVPLFALMLWALAHRSPAVRRNTRSGLASFMVIHGGLHWAFHEDPHYHFDGWLAHGLVGGAAVFGALYLAAGLGARPSSSA